MNTQYIVCALYHFVTLDNIHVLQSALHKIMKQNHIMGTLLLAKEGINGTISGSRSSIDTLIAYLKTDPRFATLTTKESFHDHNPFERTKVKLKKEIVTMGLPDIDPNHRVGTYVKPQDWNTLISDPNVVVIDTRNDYEISIGTFKGAINPKTQTFREFPDYANKNLDKKSTIAMFCTGGIRCEKSTAYLKQQGFEKVYHLAGGILQYLEDIPPEQSLWEGECFVFDNRVSVQHGLTKGEYDQCYACRMPITDQDKALDSYQKGISCVHCAHEKTPEQLQRYAERQKQIHLAQQANQKHIGGTMIDQIQVNKILKRQKNLNSNNKNHSI